ncbi:c-type cytochrome [Neptunomonas antarctica]|uniref:Cytochrome C oxidase, cbb3-type, subunit III n=1 Tax=Neptunomonas antarctica TaxID=619304 RepID=A0A1N7J7R5_9GAMM|nr:cytochrome c [Neptunomonas antarctica]SIS45349.1 Cytochrome C oxidase, cbb3-type, subunit III [Neptunomonas antarctica]
MMYGKQLCLLLFISTIIATGCSEKNPLKLEEGNELYSYYCMQCHIKNGVGAMYEYLPPDRQKLASHEIVLMIKYGYDMGHNMPMFDQLSAEQADAIAEYVVAIQRSTSIQKSSSN